MGTRSLTRVIETYKDRVLFEGDPKDFIKEFSEEE